MTAGEDRKKTNLKTDSFAMFENRRLATTER